MAHQEGDDGSENESFARLTALHTLGDNALDCIVVFADLHQLKYSKNLYYSVNLKVLIFLS